MPLRFTWPRKRAPTAGPVEPSIHSASNVSGLYLPMLVTSLTSSQTSCGDADMWTVTESCTPGILGACGDDDGGAQLRIAHSPRGQSVACRPPRQRGRLLLAAFTEDVTARNEPVRRFREDAAQDVKPVGSAFQCEGRLVLAGFARQQIELV